MIPPTLLYVLLTTILIVSIAFNYYQKRKISKMLRLLDVKTENLMLAIRAGNIAVWGYDVKQERLYNIEGEIFPTGESTIEEAMTYVHPDDCEKFRVILQKVIDGVMPSETVCIRLKNMYTGQWEYVEKEFAIIRSNSGMVKTVIGTHKDVTRRVLEAKHTDSLLKQYQQLYTENQTILNSLPTGVSIYDKEGKLFYVNRMMCDLLKVESPDDLLQANICLWSNPFVPEDVKTKIKLGKNTPFEYQIGDASQLAPSLRQLDEPVSISCFSNIVKNEESQIVSYIFIHRDITLQKQNEKEIKEISATLMHVIDASDLSVWEYSVDERKFYSYRGKICVENGTSYEDVLARHTPESAARCDDIFCRMIQGATSVEHAMFELVDPQDQESIFYKCELVARKDQQGNLVKIYGIQKEVTQERNYQLELEESKLKTQLAIKICDMVQWEYDVEKQLFRTVNEKIESDTMTIDDYRHVTHPDDLQKIDYIFELMNSKINENFELDVRFKFPSDDRWQYVNISGTSLKQDSAGAVLKYTGFQRNHTKWHDLTMELKEKDAMNTLILKNMRSGLAYLSNDHKVIWENTSTKFSMDFTDNKPLFEVGKHCHQTHIGIDTICENCILEGLCVESGSKVIERVLDNGNVLEITANPVIDDTRNMIGIILRVDDITQRKQLYQELEVSRNDALSTNRLLYEILNRIPGALFIKDPDDDYRYVIANRVFSELFGVSESDIIGKTDFEFMDLESATTYRENDIQVMAQGERLVFNEETYIGGVHRSWNTIKSSFRSIHNRELLIGISVDVSEMRKTNEELKRAKNRAEESDRLKSAFLANMSHEIRTPLNAIVGFSELIQTCDDEQEKEEYIRIISANTDLLLRLINDILDLSKLESGIVQLHNTKFDLSEYFDELASEMRQRITNPNIEFIAVNPYESCIVETDKTRMAQVWQNFMSNAIKYTVSGQITMGYQRLDNGIKIYVKDTGIGIAEDKKQKLFQRFEKLDSFAQGTGLGLSICKAISELDGGTVGFESTQGEGSLFWSWKPIRSQISCKVVERAHVSMTDEQRVETLEFEAKSPGDKLRVLVAEDNDSNYLLMSHILKNEFQLFRAINGAQAVYFTKNNPVDFILMDIRMPEMDGLQATRLIREFNQDVPIIALTANAFELDRKDAFENGCTGFMTKPLRREALDDVLMQCKIS